MPYSRKRYGTRVQYDKFRRCVKKVKKKKTAVSPYAVCRATIYGKRNPKKKTEKWLNEFADAFYNENYRKMSKMLGKNVTSQYQAEKELQKVI